MRRAGVQDSDAPGPRRAVEGAVLPKAGPGRLGAALRGLGAALRGLGAALRGLGAALPGPGASEFCTPIKCAEERV